VVCGRSGAVTAGTRVTITIDTAACPVRADGDTTFVLGTTSSTSVRLTSQESATPPTLRLTSAGTAATATATTLGTARLHAVNKAGTEYACAQGWGIFDGPHDQASVNVLKSWGINAVRVPLNEDCWLGINGVPSAYGGASYRTAIKGWTDLLRANSMRVILDLHWSAPGATLATGQAYMADADHSPAFWRSVAGTYKGDQGVLFDLFNEPHHVSWSVWRNGDATWAGMNQLIDAVRSTGATNWVIASGLAWGNDDSGWLANKPTVPAG
jgi:aryl-phospho-beta-D-glucosidase BglC (GH1 family)